MTDQTVREDDVSAPPGLDRRLVSQALILALGAFVALLDTTIVAVAMHTFADYFATGVAVAQWVSTAYLLAMAAVIPATGWASQRFGATATWVVSLCVFAAGSALCGLAQSLGWLIAARVVQGAGAGMLFPLMRIIIVEVAGKDRLGRLMALIAIPVQVAPIIGPVVGGTLIQSLSWRWAFLLNVPIVVVVAVLSALFIPNARGGGKVRLDLIGTLCLGGALSLIVYGLGALSQGEAITGAGALWPLVAGVALLAAYGVRAALARTPGVIEFGLFRDRAFSASMAVTFLNNAGLFGAVFLVPLFFQRAGGAGALGAGLALAPQGLGMLVAVLLVGRLIDVGDNHRALVLGGLALVVAGTVPFALAGPGTAGPLLAGALFVRGVGLAFAVSPTMVTLYHTLAPAKVPAATTANAINQQVAGALGTAVVALLLEGLLTDGTATATAFHPVFWVVTGLAALTFAPAALLPHRAPVAEPATR